MPLVWDKERFGTGVTRIDEDHRTMFSMVNELAEKIESGETDDFLASMIDFLEKYAKVHFKREESAMQLSNCPAASQNASEHRKFERKVEDYKDRFNREGADYWLMKDLVKFLSEWLVNHICYVDVKMRDYVSGSESVDNSPII